MRCCALIVGGGRGARFGAERPKQYLELLRRPVLFWTLEAFDRCPCIETVVLVVGADHEAAVASLLKAWDLKKVARICEGGAERSDSVRAGLAAVPEGMDMVAIHDAVRPLVTPRLIEDVVVAATETGAALAALPVRDTVKQGIDGWVSGTTDRNALFLAQTPQAFRLELIRRAYEYDDPSAGPTTDDAQRVERLGHPVRLVEGDPLNFKITVPEDLALAEHLLRGRRDRRGELTARPRIGLGYDVHRLVPGRKLILGGVQLDGPLGLLGHSDADLICHAAGDALLGAASLGDLGHHFPPSDPQYRGASSLGLLERIGLLVREAGYELGNLDVVVVCERPKIAPHVAAMRQGLAAALRASPAQISVKATTTEGLGFAGKGEGIAAYATALLFPAEDDGARRAGL